MPSGLLVTSFPCDTFTPHGLHLIFDLLSNLALFYRGS